MDVPAIGHVRIGRESTIERLNHLGRAETVARAEAAIYFATHAADEKMRRLRPVGDEPRAMQTGVGAKPRKFLTGIERRAAAETKARRPRRTRRNRFAAAKMQDRCDVGARTGTVDPR